MCTKWSAAKTLDDDTELCTGGELRRKDAIKIEVFIRRRADITEVASASLYT